ncbi:hypothetical protein BGZ81_000411 [Podila clonocystis]|nr:hypothetical protein BGZ81_000411 [Podila clonocystis]
MDRSMCQILVKGKTQSGKSRLVQTIMNYADPSYEMDLALIGSGNVSKTDVTKSFYVQSNFPIYEVYQKGSGDVIDLKDLSSKLNEEDYLDFVMSRDKDVGLRVASQDPNGLSDLVEFQFLDTPGLNDTYDKDSSHAVNIISEMIKIRSFSLIIIIVSFKNVLTMEQRLALEYYANVLKGLHSRIMFLHTHVDYTDMHETNTIHQRNLKHRKNEMNNLFRRHADAAFNENDKEYPSLTIDLISKKRPVINCLIRNTIREILVMATAPPAVLDTSLQNIERVLGITHPSRFSDEQRMTIKDRFLAEEQKDEPPVKVEEVNILVIGDFQSGKSTLIEAFKLYADPAYVATTQTTTHVDEVKVTTFSADLYMIPVCKLRRSNGENVTLDLDEESTKRSNEDFMDLLNLSSNEAMAEFITPSSSNKYTFNIYEGPGLNEDTKNFERNIFNIHRTLVDSEKEFNKILITLAPGPPTDANDKAIRIFSDIFSDLGPLFSVVHTKIDYSILHASSRQLLSATKKRMALLPPHTQSTATSYLIDCSFQSDKPVQHAKTYSIVRDILFSAAKQSPIALKSPLMKKTPTMVKYDSEVKWQSWDPMQQIKKDISVTNSERSQLRSRIQELCTEYKEQDQFANSARNVDSRDDVEVVFEDRYEAKAEKSADIYYSHSMTCKKMPRPIEIVHIVSCQIEIEKVHGGEGFNHCVVIYHPTSAAASLEVKLYAKKLDNNGKPVGETEDMTILRHRRADLERKLDVVDLRFKDQTQEENDYNILRYCIFRETLPQEVVEKLTKAVIFDQPITRIKEVYMKSGSAFGADPYAADSGSVGRVEGSGLGHYKEYTVLMFGKTQTGKSTFIEFVKNYANQQYNIDGSLIGTGVKSKTARPTQFFIRTNLPSYEVLDSSETPVDIDSLAGKCKDADDYSDALSNREVKLKPVEDPDSQSSKYAHITFLDTPGIDDTDGKDTEHAPKIIHEMAKMRTFNLIVVIVNCLDHQSMSQQLSFNYYSKVIHALQGHHKNVVFVYTHVDYAQCHPTNVNFNKNIQLRHMAFSRLFRGFGHKAEQEQSSHSEGQELEDSGFPMYTIDLKRNHRPIPRCMLLRTLRDILQLAVKKDPVPMNTIMKNLLRVYGIYHPDELNVMQRARILGPVRAILEQRRVSSVVPTEVSESVRAQGDTSNGIGDEVKAYDQSGCVLDDCKEYFPEEDALHDSSSSGDEDENGIIACQNKLSQCILDTALREE